MTAAPTHHPTLELLIDYAAGAASEAETLCIAGHLALCPDCRGEVLACEAVGGALLMEAMPEAPVSGECLLATLARLDESEPAAGAMAPASSPSAALGAFLGDDPTTLPWAPVAEGTDEFKLPLCCRGFGSARLVRLAPGASVVPRRSRGPELTLVISGTCRAGATELARGDLSATDEQRTLQPLVGGEAGCVVLNVSLSRREIEAAARAE